MATTLNCLLSCMIVCCLVWRVNTSTSKMEQIERILEDSGMRHYIDTWATSSRPSVDANLLQARDTVRDRNPVLLIPPYAGVQLDLKIIYRAKVRHWYCPRSTVTWIFAWLNPLLLVPGEFGCYADAMRLELDPSTGLPVPPQGVQVRARPGFDSAMQLLANDPSNRSATMKFLAEALEKLGWTRDQDLRAHLYDWRLGPLAYEAEGGSFVDLKKEIEELYEQTGKPVTIVSYSMGSIYFNLFIQKHVTAEWKDKYVRGLVSVSGVWGGSPKAVLGVLSGKWAHLEDLLNEETMKYLARGTPAITWLMPDKAVFNNTCLVVNKAYGECYAAEDLPAVLKAAGAKESAQVLTRLNKQGARVLTPPQLPVYCFYGTGVPTTASMLYTTKDFSDTPTESTSDGDGTVPVESLSICGAWAGQQTQPVHAQAFPGIGHTEMFNTPKSLVAIVDAVVQLAKQDPSKPQ